LESLYDGRDTLTGLQGSRVFERSLWSLLEIYRKQCVQVLNMCVIFWLGILSL